MSLNCPAPAAVVLMYWYGSGGVALDQVSVLVFPLPGRNVRRPRIGGVNPRALVIFVPTFDITCLTPLYPARWFGRSPGVGVIAAAGAGRNMPSPPVVTFWFQKPGFTEEALSPTGPTSPCCNRCRWTRTGLRPRP